MSPNNITVMIIITKYNNINNNKTIYVFLYLFCMRPNPK